MGPLSLSNSVEVSHCQVASAVSLAHSAPFLTSFRTLIMYSVMGKMTKSDSFDDESEFESSRYTPPLKRILTELISNSLSMEDYPSVVPMPTLPKSTTSASSARRRGGEGSARKKAAGSKWSKTDSPSTAITNFSGARSIVFMIGGLSYSELKVSREVMEKESREVMIGSTAFLSPKEFLEDISSLTQ